jgi:hypothetical protein
VAETAILRAISWPVSVLVENTMQASGKYVLKSATMGAAAVTSPTDTAWIHILGEPFISLKILLSTNPNFGPRLFLYFPVHIILAA